MQTPSMDRDYARLRWQCRRGMLELDLILQHYLDAQFDTMKPQEIQHFTQLLTQSDQTLLAWCLGYQAPEHAQDQHIIQHIRQSVSA